MLNIFFTVKATHAIHCQKVWYKKKTRPDTIYMNF